MQMWLPRLASNLSERLSSPAARSPPRFVGTYATSRSRLVRVRVGVRVRLRVRVRWGEG